MKLRFYNIIILLISLSCSKDEVINVDQGDEDNNVPDEIVNTTPCNFTLKNVAPNTKLTINCVLDLKGETVNLPSGVELVFDKGQIINGVVNFESNGSIDGDLLNLSLSITGDAKLSNENFNFFGDRWEMKEGTVTNEVALENRKNLQKAIDLTSALGATKFSVEKIDVYFKITPIDETQPYGNTIEHTILLPSNFHLSLHEETVFRVQPNAFPWYSLMTIDKKENVKISGGNFIGDRYEHDYVPFFDRHGLKRSTHEWGVLLLVRGSENINIDNITLKSSIADGLITGSEGHRIYPETVWNKKVSLTNSIVSDNRRNNISITDGEDILIEGNEILDAGIGETLKDNDGNTIYSSAGVAPRFGLDVEPFVGYDDFSFESRKTYEWVENVIIRNNIFKGNEAGSIIVYTGDNVLIDGNFSDHVIAQNNTSGSKIINNTLEARDDVRGRIGISTSDYRKFIDFDGGTLKQYATGNDVKNNTIRNFFGGYNIRGNNAEVSGNTVEGATVCLLINKAENIKVHDNTYTSGAIASKAIRLTDYANNIEIYNEKFTLSNGFYLESIDFNMPNDDFHLNVDNFKVTIRESEFNSFRGPTIKNSRGVEILKNKIYSTTLLKNVTDIKFNNNTSEVINLTYHGISLENTSNSEIKNNHFTVKKNVFEGIFQVDSSVNTNNIIVNNTVEFKEL
ncbi:right-handed parallel beta-helix repeat-containing protein [Tenacibaculum jejuense]|uniref:Probable lipoprotein n=1 Tax=Tenacibaculum jejuense TaxID=584609 RepID=A0A238U6X6_9FLAO|nr:right-handed parallel beta-helix repeat-containing protein [Tenacibaculum jejuense]SNR14815.1 Probable lipoprotein precursor [Tenacibaculum jejuense]